VGRRRGSRNADYDQERDAEVTPSTLRHYFGNREGVLAATFARVHREGTPFIAAAATEEHGPAPESLAWFVANVRLGWERFGVGRAHALGLIEGLGNPMLGPGYLTHLLEPTLQAAEARLARHVARGELAPCNIRYAAVELLAPVILALLHQQALCGDQVRPLDVNVFVADHLGRFLRAHGPDPRRPASRGRAAPRDAPAGPSRQPRPGRAGQLRVEPRGRL
jgi:AcrR family transcriptional regulator